jgi:hypothetical protein
MYFTFRAFFTTVIFGVFGYLITLVFLVFNKYIGHALTHQSNPDNLSFLGTLVYIFNNTLTNEDFMLCIYGLMFMAFVGVLKNFERRTRIY